MDAHTLALIPLHQFCLCVCVLTAYACTGHGPEIDTPHACTDRFWTVYTVHLVTRCKSEKHYPNTLFCYLVTWTASALSDNHRLNGSPGHARPRTIVSVIFCVCFTRPPKHVKTICLDHEPYTHKNYQCVCADKNGQNQSCKLPKSHQNPRFVWSWF